jgi:hypothetical protein
MRIIPSVEPLTTRFYGVNTHTIVVNFNKASDGSLKISLRTLTSPRIYGAAQAQTGLP